MADLTEPASTTTESGSEKPKGLTRSIGVLGGTLLTMTCVTPASSLFVIVPPLFAQLGTGTALTIAVAGLLCIGVALCYAELGTLVPSAGGEYSMVGTLINRCSGWLVFALAMIVVLIVPPILACGTGDYLQSILHISDPVAGCLVMLLATVMGLLNLRANAWITGIFLVLEVAAAAVVAFLGFGHASRSPEVLVQPSIGTGLLGPAVLVAGLAVALFVLQGFSTAVYLSEEMTKPKRTVPRTLLWTLLLSALVILIPVVAITIGAPSMSALTGGDLASIVAGWSNSAVGTFVSLCIAAAIINAGIVMVIQNSRVLYASARDLAWPNPVNRALTTVSKRFSAPWVATLCVGLPGAALCFVPIDTLNGVTGVAVAALYLAVAVSALFARRNRHRGGGVWRMPLWPAIPVVLIVVLIYVLTQQTVLDLALTGGFLLLATVYWAVYLRPRASTHWVISLPEDQR